MPCARSLPPISVLSPYRTSAAAPPQHFPRVLSLSFPPIQLPPPPPPNLSLSLFQLVEKDDSYSMFLETLELLDDFESFARMMRGRGEAIDECAPRSDTDTQRQLRNSRFIAPVCPCARIARASADTASLHHRARFCSHSPALICPAFSSPPPTDPRSPPHLLPLCCPYEASSTNWRISASKTGTALGRGGFVLKGKKKKGQSHQGNRSSRLRSSGGG